MRYFLITYLTKPGGQIDESVTVTKNIKTNDLQTCNVILDYTEKKVVKCVIEGKVVETTWENLDTYYKNVYPSVIERLEEEAKEMKKKK